MRQIKKGVFRKTVINLYDSIKELPILRYHEFTKLVLEDLHIGSDMTSVGKHFSNFHTLLAREKSAEALQEAENLHNNFYYIIERISIKSFCFLALV